MYETPHVVKPYYIHHNKIYGFNEDNNGSKHLTLIHVDKNKDEIIGEPPFHKFQSQE